MLRPLLRDILLEAQAQGFLSEAPVERQWEHALGFVELVRRCLSGRDRPGTVLDLGSGGGVPGLVLATALQAPAVYLLDGSTRRAGWLRETVDRLGIGGRVQVVASRAEEAARDPRYRASCDVVVSRSFAVPAVTAECAAGFLASAGRLIVSEPPESAADVSARWSASSLTALGLGPPEAVIAAGFSFAVLVSVAPCPERYPRRVGIPAKRPLF